jgi:hypothetical protein
VGINDGEKPQDSFPMYSGGSSGNEGKGLRFSGGRNMLTFRGSFDIIHGTFSGYSHNNHLFSGGAL